MEVAERITALSESALLLAPKIRQHRFVMVTRAEAIFQAAAPGAAAAPSARTQELLDTAWSFPGSRHAGASTARYWAVLGAVVLHAGLLTIRPAVHEAAPEQSAVVLETLIPIEQDVPEPEPELVPEEEMRRDPEAVPSRVPPSAVVPTSAAQDGNLEEGPTPEEVATDVASSEFGSSDFELPSSGGLALSRGRIARPGSGGRGLSDGVARNTSLTARDLSRSAIPPHLQPFVDANFPAAARLARAEGTVTVTAIIQPDGNPTDVRVVSVNPSGRGFGESCTRTLHEGPDWKPKLNRDGRPVAAKVSYTCRFSLPDDVAIDVDGPTSGAGANRVWTNLK